MARPRKFDEREVLLAARSRFWRGGYQGTSMSDLCDATGVASQSLYGAFGSKHDLFVRTLDEYCAEQLAGLEAGRRSARDAPWEWLLSAVSFDDGGRLGLSDDGCYLSGSTAMLSRTDKDVHKASRRTYERILGIFGEMVSAAQAAGEVRSDVAPDRVALALLAAMQGIEFLRKSGLDDATFRSAKTSVLDSLNLAYAEPVASRKDA
ncbi:TetR/AcrR family transcriptional regulator [Streptomyces sp. CA-253872]|uniref:TetR/AcrR family transcriptional regulator n=1 Tax=Streptomyces sp. CA-253872 TaxID=3240067 RepID=UPI003D920987